jgi:thiosulfate reductase cytochrome b subunit
MHSDRTGLGVMEGKRGVELPDRPGSRSVTSASPASDSGWAAPAAAILVVVCCAGPLLLGFVVATGAGGWLAAHGFVMRAAALVFLAAILALGAWARARRG